MLHIRKSESRGKANHGWLQSRHTFSFASYYDPQHMGISALRVINDDQIAPGRGFGAHSHQDMEIISYVKKGTIEHKDSMGNIERLPAGEFQLMSAGTGITHSEYNPSTQDVLSFLQIWIEPSEFGIQPGYQQKNFAQKMGLQLIASPDGINGTLQIHQDVRLLQLRLAAMDSESYSLAPGRHAYLHVVEGDVRVNDEILNEGDGAHIHDTEALSFYSVDGGEALLFDLP